MEKDFHYYMVYSLAKVTQMPKPDVIAYASQFVDDNNEGQFSINGEETAFPEKLKTTDGYYYPIMTQSLSVKSLDPYVQRYVYVPFHFLPGDDTMTIQGQRNRWSVTPNSKNARALLQDALDDGSPYQIGIALHTFADTWSHQNFSGLKEDWNKVYPWYECFKALVPSIGHAEAGHSPDVISETWTDYRLDQPNRTICNQGRALLATAAVFDFLHTKTRAGPNWGELESAYRTIIQTADYDQRIQAIANFLQSSGMGPMPKYSPDDWIDDALDKGEDEVVLKNGFQDTDWFRFHQAAKRHFARAVDLLGDL